MKPLALAVAVALSFAAPLPAFAQAAATLPAALDEVERSIHVG